VIYFGRFISETRPIPADFDAIISNAGGCGSHLRAYGHLLHDDPAYAQKASAWLAKLRDIHEYLVEIQFRPPSAPVAHAVSLRAPHPATHCAAHPAAAATAPTTTVTYHESCHLCHGQQVSAQPRAILRALPKVVLRECAESHWCCGSAGIYNITQPETAARLQERKVGHVLATGAHIVATANPGCHLQLAYGLAQHTGNPGDPTIEVTHPVVLLARAYAAEKQMGQQKG
jgi:glycolate oxidase iron-sulfur subunit